MPPLTLELKTRQDGYNLRVETVGRTSMQLVKNARIYLFDDLGRFPEFRAQMTTIELVSQEVKDECSQLFSLATGSDLSAVQREIARACTGPTKPKRKVPGASISDQLPHGV